MQGGIEFVKGHGTENDFVLLPDLDGTLELTPSRVRALCDRHAGLAADGVLRVVPTSAVPDVPADTDWFMDYRNSDGSVAEMCGNGARVFARYLAETGLVRGAEVCFGTRAGSRTVQLRPDGAATVGMGPVTTGARSTATVDDAGFDGVVVDVGNPHLVCITETPVGSLDLSVPPGHESMLFPNGVNVEFVNRAAGGHLRMRVHERGVGESRSCGTGAVAAAAAALHTGRAGRSEDGEAVVEVPGGQVHVTIRGGVASLTGPAVLAARGRLDMGWWLTA